MKRYIEEVIIVLYLILIALIVWVALMVWGIWHYWIVPAEDSTHTTHPTLQVMGHAMPDYKGHTTQGIL